MAVIVIGDNVKILPTSISHIDVLSSQATRMVGKMLHGSGTIMDGRMADPNHRGSELRALARGSSGRNPGPSISTISTTIFRRRSSTRAKAYDQRKGNLCTYAAFYAVAFSTADAILGSPRGECPVAFRHIGSFPEYLAGTSALGQPKGPKEDAELASLKIMYKELKDKPNLPEDVQQVLRHAEATLRKADAKSHKQLIDQLKTARKRLSDLDEQWEAYRVQWASYIEKASQLWLSHLEDFETGETKFVEKRKDLLQHLQDTRLRLHEVHMRTMEQGSDGAEEGGADVATAQEALDATMQFEEQETPVLDQDFAKIKKELTGVVKQVKDTIEDKLRGRDRSRSRSKKEPDEVEILEPAPKRTRDSD